MFFGAKKADSKETELQKLRQRQIQEFEKAVPIARALDAGKSAYDVPVQTQFGRLIFRVMLDATFPERAPRIRVMMKVTHAWVDDDMYVRHDKLTHWGPYNNLGKIVSEIYAEFAARPPAPQMTFGGAQQAVPVAIPAPSPSPQSQALSVPSPSPHGLGPGMVFVPSPHGGGAPVAIAASPGVLSMTPTPVSGNPFALPPRDAPPVPPRPAPLSNGGGAGRPGAAAAGGSSRGNAAGGGGGGGAFRTPVPEVPTSFPELDAFGSAQLEDLLSDDAVAILEMVANRSEVRAMRETRADLANGVEAVAKKNLESKAEVAALTASVRALKQQLEEKTKTLAALQERQARVLQKYSLKGVLAVLNEEIERLDEKSDALQRRYKDGDDDDDGPGARRGGGGMMDDDFDDGSDKKSVISVFSAPATPASMASSAAAFSALPPGKLDHVEFCRQYIRLRKRFHARAALRDRLVDLYGRV